MKGVWEMGKKISVLILIFLLMFTGCSSKENTASNSSTKPQESKIDYSKYTGTWVMEINLKNDFLYGTWADITVDKEGNVKGMIASTKENLTRIANVEVSGAIKDNKLTSKFNEDGWEHNGTIDMEFKENTIVLTMKYGEGSSKDNMWGIGEGTFNLISNKTMVTRTLSSLKDGGLVVFDNQSFVVDLESYGKVKLISGLKREDSTEIAVFYLLDGNNVVLYKLPPFYGNGKSRFIDIKAIAFNDVDRDGMKDVIIMANYEGRTVSSIYFQKGKEFTNNITVDDMINASAPKTIDDILKLTREK